MQFSLVWHRCVIWLDRWQLVSPCTWNLFVLHHDLIHLHCLIILVILCSRLFDRRAWSKPRKVSRGISVASRKANKQGEYCDESMLSHIMWWKEVFANSCYLYMHQCCFFCYLLILYYLMFQKMEKCRKPSSVQLTQRLVYSNILGLDPNLRNGRWGICFMCH